MKSRLFLSLAIGSLLSVLVLAGTLDPPGPPAPTMVTLQQIYDKVNSTDVGVARTGQTGCWNASGTPITCAGTGQDGALLNGVFVSPRFTDNLDGTVKDEMTALIWLQNANCFGTELWTSALSLSNTLASGSCGLTDGSMAGDWRLPNVRELHSLIDYGQSNPALPAGHPFSGVQSSNYWTSTTEFIADNLGWIVVLSNGLVGNNTKNNSYYVWPVRGGV